jgi:hypothetical protein
MTIAPPTSGVMPAPDDQGDALSTSAKPAARPSLLAEEVGADQAAERLTLRFLESYAFGRIAVSLRREHLSDLRWGPAAGSDEATENCMPNPAQRSDAACHHALRIGTAIKQQRDEVFLGVPGRPFQWTAMASPASVDIRTTLEQERGDGMMAHRTCKGQGCFPDRSFEIWVRTVVEE